VAPPASQIKRGIGGDHRQRDGKRYQPIVVTSVKNQRSRT